MGEFPKVGTRVIAISASDDDHEVIYLYGAGKYEGLFVPIEGDPDFPVNIPGQMAASQRLPHPRIRLDNGMAIWGCECFWGKEKTIKRVLDKAKKIEERDIREVRVEYCRMITAHLN